MTKIKYWYCMRLEEGWSDWRECTRARWKWAQGRWDYATDVTEHA